MMNYKEKARELNRFIIEVQYRRLGIEIPWIRGQEKEYEELINREIEYIRDIGNDPSIRSGRGVLEQITYEELKPYKPLTTPIALQYIKDFCSGKYDSPRPTEWKIVKDEDTDIKGNQIQYLIKYLYGIDTKMNPIEQVEAYREWNDLDKYDYIIGVDPCNTEDIYSINIMKVYKKNRENIIEKIPTRDRYADDEPFMIRDGKVITRGDWNKEMDKVLNLDYGQNRK